MAENEYPVPDDIRREYDEAVGLLERCEHEEARIILSTLLERFPDEPRLVYSLGITYYHEDGDATRAKEYFLKAIELAPGLSVALSAISTLYGSTGKYEESAEYARRAIRALPQNAAAWNTLGLYYVRVGRVEVGLDYFIAAYAFDRDNSASAYNAACALTELGRYDEALKYLEKALVTIKRIDEAKNDPVFDTISETTGFVELIKKAEKVFGAK